MADKIVQWKQKNGTSYDLLYPVIKDGYITYSKLAAGFTLPWSQISGTNPFTPVGAIVLNSSCYGTSLPNTNLTEGRIFFLKI